MAIATIKLKDIFGFNFSVKSKKMSPFSGFSQLEGEARSVLELLTDTTENLKPTQLQERIEAGERQSKEALDDHYVSMRLIRFTTISFSADFQQISHQCNFGRCD